VYTTITSTEKYLEATGVNFDTSKIALLDDVKENLKTEHCVKLTWYGILLDKETTPY